MTKKEKTRIKALISNTIVGVMDSVYDGYNDINADHENGGMSIENAMKCMDIVHAISKRVSTELFILKNEVDNI